MNQYLPTLAVYTNTQPVNSFEIHYHIHRLHSDLPLFNFAHLPYSKIGSISRKSCDLDSQK